MEQELRTEADVEKLKAYGLFQIQSDNDATYVAERVAEIKAEIKEVEEQRLGYTRPLDEAKGKLIADEKKITDPLKSIIGVLNEKLVSWTSMQRFARQVEANKLRAAELDALQQEKLYQLVRASEGNEEAGAAIAEIEKNQERLVATAVFVPNTIKTDKGYWSVQTRWKYEITDIDKIPKEFLCVDEKKLQAYATAMKEAAVVPGVKFYMVVGGISK